MSTKSSMDVASVEVLARKEFLLRNYLLWNDELTDALRVNLVLSENNVDSVKKSHNNASKTAILIDRIKCKGRQDVELGTIADTLAETRHSFVPQWYNSWLSDELREELACELATMPISEDIARECATIVHREFGHTKRLSEFEKKSLTQIIRERFQLTSNVWHQRCTTVNGDVDTERSLLQMKEDKAQQLGADTADFVQANKHRLPKGQTQLTKKTSMATLLADDGRASADVFGRLKKGIMDVRQLLSSSLLAAEWLDNDRLRVLRKMGLKAEALAAAALDEEIQLALERNRAAILEAERRMERREGEYDLLLSEIAAHQREHLRKMESKDKNIAMLDNELQRSEQRSRDLENEVKAMMRQLKIGKLELNEWVDWYESIDHSRRLNHIYQRDMHKLKDKTVQEPSNEEEDDELTPDRDVASSGAAEVVQRQPAKPRPTSRPKAKAVGLKSTSTKKKAPSK